MGSPQDRLLRTSPKTAKGVHALVKSSSSSKETSAATHTAVPVLGDAVKAFETFVIDHYQAAYRFALSLCGCPHDASDITQQAFYLAQTRSEQLRDSGKRKQWLFTIIYREFLGTVRHKSAHPHIALEFCDEVLPHISVDHSSKLDSKHLLAVLKRIEENYRAPLVLFYLDQLSYKEIAIALDIPIGTVMSRLARGKQMLRRELEKEGGSGFIPKKMRGKNGKGDE